jgi:putative tryptophan/tyrosine transport system substrate-binding protein
MRRREFVQIAATVAAWPLAARAQQKSLPTVGYLGISSPTPMAPLLSAFHEGLREMGFAEGRNVRLEYRWAEGIQDRLPGLAAELAVRNVDVIATHGGAAVVRAAKNAAPNTPIVFETGIDPVAAGLVASMARPGGNLTGVSILTSELNAKRFELLAEMVPQVRVFAILVNPRNASSEHVVAQLQPAAQARGLQMRVVRAAAEDEYEPAFLHARAEAGALLVANDPVFFSRHQRLVALAARHEIPAVYEWREFVEAGGLMSYGTSIAGMHRDKGRYVGRVLAGAKPANLPILQPTTFELVINLKTAKTLGLTVPPTLLARAHEVIE